MRFFLLSLLLYCSTVLAQDSVKLSGTIVGHNSDTVKITYNTNRLAWFPKEYYAQVDANGYFSMKFPVPAEGYVQAELRHGRRLADMLLHAGDSLVFSANTVHFDSTTHYEGRGSNINNFLALHTLERGRLNHYNMRMRNAMSTDPEVFLVNIKKEKQTELDLLDKYKSTLPPAFVKYWIAYHNYYTWFFMQQYPLMHEMAVKRRYTDTISLQSYSLVKEIPVAYNDEYLDLPPYLLYLTGILDAKLRATGMNFPSADVINNQRLHDTVQLLAYKQMPTGSAEYFIAQDIYGRARRQPLDQTQKAFSKFKKKWPHSEYLPLLERQVGYAERLAPGQPAPDFDITTMDGNHMKLSDLKGKVVYLSFWATNCKQCIGEMIGEKKVLEAIRNKQLEFVHVQLDDDTTIRNKFFEKYKPAGIFTQAKGSWNSKEAELYGVTGMPAYFLIDEDGNIAVQNAPSPAQRVELIVAIQKLFR